MFHLRILVLVIFGALSTCLSDSGLGPRVANAQQGNFQQRNLDTITKIYNRNLYPTNLQFIANGSQSVLTGLFNENATRRISPLGNFTGFAESTEYFFALAPIPRPPNYVAITKAQIISFQSQCPNVASSVVYFTSTVVNANATNNGAFFSTLNQVAFWEFDDKGAVLKYDAWIPNLGLYIQQLSRTHSGNLSAAEIQRSTIKGFCDAVQSECTYSNTQYKGSQDCIDTLSAKPFENWEEVWMDSVVCRELHILLARVDPKIHCPHVGPTGGSKCINEPYEEGYFASGQALFGKPAGENFICDCTT